MPHTISFSGKDETEFSKKLNLVKPSCATGHTNKDCRVGFPWYLLSVSLRHGCERSVSAAEMFKVPPRLPWNVATPEGGEAKNGGSILLTRSVRLSFR